MKERLAHIRGKTSKGQTSVYYVRYNPKSQDMYDAEEATEDMLWLIAEVEKLRVEVNDLQSPRSLAGKRHAAPGTRANARLS